jgi:hypothetical protein
MTSKKSQNIYILISIILFITIACPAYADSNYAVGINTTIWADIYNGTSYASSANNANITIITPNLGTSKFVMQSTSQAGLFYYNYTPTQTGQYYYAVQYYNGATLLATASNTFVAQSSSASNIGGSSMFGITIILAIGIFASLLLYMSFNIEKKHQALQLFLLGFFVFAIFLIGKATLDATQECSIVLNSTAGTSNNYTSFCQSVSSDTALLFYKVTLWFMRFFISYIFVFFIWELFTWILGIFKGKRKA